jgi:branched-chain amino acid transport system substrate-binding protein
MAKRLGLLFGLVFIALAAILFARHAQAQSGPLRVGFLTVRSGPLAAGGKQMEQGIEFFLKERGNMLGGRKVELIIADTGGQPAQAKTKTQELIERDKVHVVIGPLATFEALAIDDYIAAAKVPLITPTSAAQNDLAQKQKNDYVIHAAGTAAQPMHVLGQYAAKKLGIKRMAMIADDFAYGHEGAAGFQRAYEDNGGRVVQKLWSPLNTPEYGVYVGQLKTNVDGLYIGFAGINGARFLRVWQDYQSKTKMPVFGNPTAVDEGVLRNMGDEALGVWSASWYSAGLDTPDNHKFVAGIEKEYKVTPGFYTAGTYTAGLVLEAAMDAINGRFEDKAAFIKALHNVKLSKGPMGPISFDAYGKPVLSIYIRKVERKNGQLVNSIVETFAGVNQFWSYDPKAFMSGPQYSRDVPASKYLE